jgi:hypothetical protein
VTVITQMGGQEAAQRVDDGGGHDGGCHDGVVGGRSGLTGELAAELLHQGDHRHRRGNIAQNLALTRNALLAIISFGPDEPLSGWFEICQRKPAKAIQLILHAAPIQ